MFLALGREGTRAALLRKPLKARCPVGQTRNPQSGTWLLVLPTLPAYFSKSLWSGLTLQPYKTVGNASTWACWGMGAHPVVDVGLPAGDRDEDPLLPASSLSLHILSCLCPNPPYPGSQAVTLTLHTLPREVSLARLTGRSTGMASDIAPALWPSWPLIRGAPSRRPVMSRDAS